MPSKYLPIGSIVKLKNNDKKIMIIGYYSLEYNNSVKIYDYVGCSYPEGMLVRNNSYSFNHGDIASVVFTGYLDTAYNRLNANLLDQNNNDEGMEKPSSFVNVKFDKNGVVVYDELSPVKEEATIIEDSISNPFNSRSVKEATTKTPIVDIKLDSLSDIKKDEQAISDTKEIESKFNFTFDANGVVIGEVPVEIPKEDDSKLKQSNLMYEFDENGIVVGIKSPDEKNNDVSNNAYKFDADGIVVANDDNQTNVKNEEEFEIPHYKFDENGIIIG